MNQLNITAEELAYWYFRLNGFLTIQNFIVHDVKKANQRTEVDILGVRLPFRNEIGMEDDACITKDIRKPLYIIAEVKAGLCKLNGPWTKPENENMQRVLGSLGALEKSHISIASESLYKNGFYECDESRMNLICIGKSENEIVKSNFPDVPQILFNDILKFIWSRFKSYHEQKKNHHQWSQKGKDLWDLYDINRNDIDNFIKSIEIT